MKQVRFEWLKISKNKLHIIVLICLLIIPVLTVKKGYDLTIEAFHFPTVESAFATSLTGEISYALDDGVVYEGFEAVVHLDQINHAIAGYESDEWYAEKRQILEEKSVNAQTEKTLDEALMQKRYGDNWKQLYEKSINNTLTHREYISAIGERYAGGAKVDLDSIMSKDLFRVYYNEAYVIEQESIGSFYGGMVNEDWNLFEKENFLFTKDKLADLGEYERQRQLNPIVRPSVAYPKIFMKIPVDSSEEEFSYLNSQFLKKSLYKDGSGAYTFLLKNAEALKAYLPWILLLLGILLTGIFNMEYHHKTDQSLRAMKQGNATQARAKMKLGFMLFAGFSIYTLLLILLVPQFMIGYHSLAIGGNYLWNASYEMILICGFFITSMLFYYAVTMLVSAYAKSKFIAFIIYAMVVVITCYSGDIATSLLRVDWTWINSILPGCFFTAPYYTDLFSCFGIIFEGCYLLVIIFLIIAIVMLFLAHQHYRRREIVNA